MKENFIKMEFYKEIKQERKKLNDTTLSLSNLQQIDNLDNWNKFVAKFKELINQKVKNNPQKDSFFISDSKLKDCWPKDKDDKMLDAKVISQLLDMTLGIDVDRNFNTDFYINVSCHSNYKYSKHIVIAWIALLLLSIIFVIFSLTSLFTFIITVIFGIALNVLFYVMFKKEIFEFKYLRKLRKKVLVGK